MEALYELWDVALDKVSSINSVVRWFRNRTKEALANGATSIHYTTSNGSAITFNYPKMKMKKV